MTDILSQITTHLSQNAVRSILNGVTLGTGNRAESYDPALVESDQGIEKEVCVTAGQMFVQMHISY